MCVSFSLCKSLSELKKKTQLEISEIFSQPYTAQHSNFEAMTAFRDPKYRLRAALFILIPRRIFSYYPLIFFKCLLHSSRSLYLHSRFQFLASIAFDCSISSRAESFSSLFAALCIVLFGMFWRQQWEWEQLVFTEIGHRWSDGVSSTISFFS